MNFINKKEAMDLLQITSDRSLQRYVKRFDVETKSLGVGKPKLYSENDLVKLFAKIKDNKDKFAPASGEKAKVKKKKEIVIKKNEEEKKQLQEKRKDYQLNELGLKHFKLVQKQLQDEGTFKEADIGYLIAYAKAFQTYVYYHELSQELDHSEIDASGSGKLHRYFVVAEKSLKQMEAMGKILGIGAKPRDGIKTEDVIESNPFEQFMN